MAAVQLSDLTLCYDGMPLFERFNFALPEKRWTALLGKSGIGKSTLLRAIAGLEDDAITNGKIARFGTVGYMAQQDSLFPWLSVLDNVQLAHHLNGTKNADTAEQAKGLLSAVKMQAHANKACYQLSGGQRQRVALARVLMQQADIVLMDEPFSALDAVTRRQLQNLACELLKDKTVLLITHDPQEALRLGDDIYILQHQPVTLSEKIAPQGEKPRQFADETLWQLQEKLLLELMSDTAEEQEGRGEIFFAPSLPPQESE